MIKNIKEQLNNIGIEVSNIISMYEKQIANLEKENKELRSERDELRKFQRSIPLIKHIKQPNGKIKCLECGLEREEK